MAQGLRQAIGMVVVSALVAAALAGLWFVVQGDGFARAMGVVLLAAAGLWTATSASDSTRAGMMDMRALIGRGPERAPADLDRGMTGLAIMLFVSLPLAAAGLVMLGSA